MAEIMRLCLIISWFTGTYAGKLYGFLPDSQSYDLKVVQIDVQNGNTSILATIPSSDANCGTASKDASRGVFYNSIRALADNSFSLQGFAIQTGTTIFQAPLPPFVTQGDVGRSGAFVMTAYDPTANTVFCTGPTSFDADGFFTAAVYKVDVGSKAVTKVADLPGSFIEAIARAVVVDRKLLLTYASKGASQPSFFAVDVSTNVVTKHSDSGMFYLDYDSHSKRIVGFCSESQANSASSCVLDPKTLSVTPVSPLVVPDKFNSEMELEFAFDSSTGHACWELANLSGVDRRKDEPQNYLVCHDFNSGKVVNKMPLVKGAIDLTFFPSAEREVEVLV